MVAALTKAGLAAEATIKYAAEVVVEDARVTAIPQPPTVFYTGCAVPSAR